MLLFDPGISRVITAGVWNPSTQRFEDRTCLMLLNNQRFMYRHSPNIHIEQGFPRSTLVRLTIPAPSYVSLLSSNYYNLEVKNNGVLLIARYDRVNNTVTLNGVIEQVG